MEKPAGEQSEKLYVIGAFAKLTGVTERTLRFYDRKGLLKPSSRNDHGHRFYSDRDIFQLQKIMVLKYLDFSLEEIEQYLQRHEEDFRHTLDSQYELLLRKKQQLEHVLGTMERMKELMQDTNALDIHLLLMLIHSLQHEEKQKEWLQSQLPSSIVNVIFMEGMSKEERLKVEREIIGYTAELRRFYKKGRSPRDAEVIAVSLRLAAVYEQLLGPTLQSLSEDELAQFEAIEEEQNELDPVLFPNMFTPEEEAFFKEVFEHLDLKGNEKKEGEEDGKQQLE